MGPRGFEPFTARHNPPGDPVSSAEGKCSPVPSWYGQAWFGQVRHGMARVRFCGPRDRRGESSDSVRAWCGVVWRGKVRYGEAGVRSGSRLRPASPPRAWRSPD